MQNNFYILKKGKLKSFLKKLAKDSCLIAPQQVKGGDFFYQETKDPEKINLNYGLTSNTVKEFFFPRRETIFKYQKNSRGLIKIIPAQERFIGETVFFGLHSCDIKAVFFQDHFFAQEPKDELYWKKRDKATLISFACNKPLRKTCFCASTKCGPFLEKGAGFDLQFIDLNQRYLIEAGTGKGEKLIRKYRRFFSPAEGGSEREKSRLSKNSLGKFLQKDNIFFIYGKLKSLNLENLWEELGKRCTKCAGCSFTCPNCFCFYTQDIEHSKGRGERIRAWDSCVFNGYSRMAGGFNPHEKNSDRIKRRFFCKHYNCYRWFKMFSCTGCGRCSFICPANIDMDSLISSLMKSNQYKPLLKNR